MLPSTDITCTLIAFITGLKAKPVATHFPPFQRLVLNLLTGAEACLAVEPSGVHPVCICVYSCAVVSGVTVLTCWGIPSVEPFTVCHCSPGASVLVCEKSSHMLEKEACAICSACLAASPLTPFLHYSRGYTSWFLRQIHSPSPVLPDTWLYQLPGSCHTSSLSCLERD